MVASSALPEEYESSTSDDIHPNVILTDFSPPNTKMESGWANGAKMKHIDWLKREVEAFKRRGRNVVIVQNGQGSLALAEKGTK